MRSSEEASGMAASRGTGVAGLAREVARRIREVDQPSLTYEQYDENGEIVRVDESVRGTAAAPRVVYHVSGTGWAEPRTNWRERGMVPREGRWRQGVRMD
jgi:hypothetical protein